MTEKNHTILCSLKSYIDQAHAPRFPNHDFRKTTTRNQADKYAITSSNFFTKKTSKSSERGKQSQRGEITMTRNSSSSGKKYSYFNSGVAMDVSHFS